MEAVMVPTLHRRQFATLWAAVVACALAPSLLSPAPAGAQSADNVQKAMALLKSKATSLGPAEIRGEDVVAGKSVPALYFGQVKMNNNFEVVDDVQRQAGGTATFFVKSGDEYVRVATNVKKDDGSRAIGTVLDPKGKAIAAIRSGQTYYGDAEILGKPYVTGYEPIRDRDGNTIGIFYVGYRKDQP
jgi:hypothetical protein